jgi:DNA-binding MarR family transcriptional regulator
MTISPSRQEAIPELRLGIMRLSRRLRQERPAADALTPSQLAVLATLVRCGPMTPRALADSERIKPPSATRIVSSLEEEGLVTKEQDPNDGRQVLVHLTDRARDRVEASREAKNAWLIERMGRLSKTDQDRILAVAPLLNQLALEA